MAGSVPAAVECDLVVAVQHATSSGNDVRQAVPIHVADRHDREAAPAGAEVMCSREVARAIVDIDCMLCTWVDSDDIQGAVPVHICKRQAQRAFAGTQTAAEREVAGAVVQIDEVLPPIAGPCYFQ